MSFISNYNSFLIQEDNIVSSSDRLKIKEILHNDVAILPQFIIGYQNTLIISSSKSTIRDLNEVTSLYVSLSGVLYRNINNNSINYLYIDLTTLPDITLSSGQKVKLVNSVKHFVLSGQSPDIIGLSNLIYVDCVYVTDNLQSFYKLSIVIPTYTTQYSYKVINSHYSATNHDVLLVDNINNPIYISLPSNPQVGYHIQIVDLYNKFNQYNCIVTSSDLIESQYTSFILDTAGINIKFVFVGGSIGWKILTT